MRPLMVASPRSGTYRQNYVAESPACGKEITVTDEAVVTRPNRGQWENVVPGHPELSESFGSREEAVDIGRAVADELGLHHQVMDSDEQ